jgi:hypothetical protein
LLILFAIGCACSSVLCLLASFFERRISIRQTEWILFYSLLERELTR